MTLNLLGLTFPIAYTVSANEAICAEYGTIGEMMNRLRDLRGTEQQDVICKTAAILIQAGCQRERVRAALEGVDPPKWPLIPDSETIKDAAQYCGLIELLNNIFDAIEEGVRQKIELKDSKKNEEQASK